MFLSTSFKLDFSSDVWVFECVCSYVNHDVLMSLNYSKCTLQLYELHITPEISVRLKLSVFPWHYDPKNQIEYLCTHCLRPVMAMDNGNRLLPNCFHHSFSAQISAIDHLFISS